MDYDGRATADDEEENRMHASFAASFAPWLADPRPDEDEDTKTPSSDKTDDVRGGVVKPESGR
jgi:hypothetical protein